MITDSHGSGQQTTIHKTMVAIPREMTIIPGAMVAIHREIVVIHREVVVVIRRKMDTNMIASDVSGIHFYLWVQSYCNY